MVMKNPRQNKNQRAITLWIQDVLTKGLYMTCDHLVQGEGGCEKCIQLLNMTSKVPTICSDDNCLSSRRVWVTPENTKPKMRANPFKTDPAYL
mmetsp:Transcript_29679/g.43196  ORF Transcript_29679/g.43196 Transcript_29679/m.43196 type:complete len:93 (-) Transcript_29679:1443-1721(-)